jgi:hypothetical protein
MKARLGSAKMGFPNLITTTSYVLLGYFSMLTKKVFLKREQLFVHLK